eukprot:scaffold77164_cov30-Tisochrysis_lutea.AAC.5
MIQRLNRCRAHPRQPAERGAAIDEGKRQPFTQLVVGRVDRSNGDILVQEEERGKKESWDDGNEAPFDRQSEEVDDERSAQSRERAKACGERRERGKRDGEDHEGRAKVRDCLPCHGRQVPLRAERSRNLAEPCGEHGRVEREKTRAFIDGVDEARLNRAEGLRDVVEREEGVEHVLGEARAKADQARQIGQRSEEQHARGPDTHPCVHCQEGHGIRRAVSVERCGEGQGEASGPEKRHRLARD